MIALMSNGNTYGCLRHDFTCIQLRSLNLILLLEFQFSFVLAILTWTIKLRPNVFFKSNFNRKVRQLPIITSFDQIFNN